MLLTKIPHFKEVILMAFECPHCGYRNNEIQRGGSIASRGAMISCLIEDERDLSRQIVKQDTASILFKEIDFEIPPHTQRGQLNTVEGFILASIEGLQQDQVFRKDNLPDLYEKIEQVLAKLNALKELKQSFHVIVDDPAGNSYIENLVAPKADPKIKTTYYKRTAEQCEAIGLDPEADIDAADEAIDEVTKDEVLSFPANCPNCKSPSDCKMKIVDIPYFKEVVIMSTVCDVCGFRSNEVKAGGAIAPKGKRISLKVTCEEDLSRDILKSESCGLRIPELDLELESGTLGGKFTTVEGLLQNVYDELDGKTPFSTGDSVTQVKRQQLVEFLQKLQKAIKLEIAYTLVLDDPLGNSYLQNLYAPDPDPNMIIEDYERSWEQNEFLGLNDLNTD